MRAYFLKRTRTVKLFVFAALLGSLSLEPVEFAYSQASGRCWALEQELAMASNAPNTNAPRLARIDKTIQRQRREMDKVRRQQAQFSCRRRTGFLIFQPRQAPQCSTILASMDEISRNLDTLNSERENLTRRDRGDSDPVRLRILQALARFDCGPQYRRYAARGRTGFSIFGGTHGNEGPYSPIDPQSGRRLLGDIPTYRTMCVRTCDGYRFPVSFATLPSRFVEDAHKCTALCPTSQTELYVYPNPGGSEEELVSLAGQNYSTLPNAWRFQTEVVEGCSCDATTLMVEAADANRRIASIGASDARPGEETPSEDGEVTLEADSPASEEPESPTRPFEDTPTLNLSIDFDNPNPEIRENGSAANPLIDQGDPAAPADPPSAKTKNTETSDEKPPRQETADYNPDRSGGPPAASDPKNLR